MTRPSKFAAALAQLKQPETPAPAAAKQPRKLNPKAQAKLMASPDAPGETPPPLPPPPPAPKPVAEPAAEAPRRGRGRPPGKKSDAQYEQTTVLLNASLKFMARVYTFHKGGDLSTVINLALEEWLAKHGGEEHEGMLRTVERSVRTRGKVTR